MENFGCTISAQWCQEMIFQYSNCHLQDIHQFRWKVQNVWYICSDRVVLEERCWLYEKGISCRLTLLNRCVQRVQLVPETEMNNLRIRPSSYKAILASRRKSEDEGCKVAVCSVNSISVKLDDETVPRGISAEKWTPVTRRFILNMIRLAVSLFCWIEDKAHWGYPT